MTTPNIKALAEQVKKNYEAQPDWAEHKIENVSYQLASALLRVMDKIESSKRNPVFNSFDKETTPIQHWIKPASFANRRGNEVL